jgi:HSP20 family molecular chaperone IbpA
MATPKTALSGASKSPQLIGEDQQQRFQEGLRQRVSERAFDLYRESGGQHGNDQSHWLQAEKEILQRGLEVRESGSWLALNASIPDSSADDIQIYLSPSRVMVRAEKQQAVRNADSQTQGLIRREIYLIEDLNTEVDPSTASAAFKDQKLTLMVKKRYPMSSTSPVSSTSSSSNQESAKA